MVASTDIAPAEGGGTRILAFMGATPSVRFLWTPKTEGAKGLQALINARVEQETRIEEGRSFTRARIAFDVSRTEIREFEIEAPADQKVVNVFDENVREWSVRETNGVQLVAVALFEPVRGTQHIAIEMERFGDAEAVSVPLVRCPGAGRQEGAIVVRAAAGLRLEMISREGVRQVDRAELPAALAQDAWDFAGRYTALPYDVRFRVEKIQPRIMAETFVTVRILPEETLVHGVLTDDVQRAGVFRLSLRVPAGYDVREVAGAAAGDARAAAVEGWKLEEAAADAPDRVLRVNLLEKAMGRVALTVSLRRAGGDPALLAPLGRSATIPIVFPRAEPTEVERETGRLVVYAPASLRLVPGTAAGLREMPVAEALQGRAAPGLGAGEQPLLAYAFERGEASLSVAAERRAPHVTARQLLVARVEPGVVRYQATFHYGILYSAVKTLRVGVPRELADTARLVTPGLRYATLAETPEDAAAGRVVWEIAGEGEFADGASLRLDWEQKIEGLDVGASVVIPVPRLEALAVDRAWGQIALAKAETIDLAPTDGVEGLEPIDPRRDLMAGAGVENAARAFEFRGPWKLGVLATRYEIKEVKTTSIERALVRAVVTRGDVTSVQALYRMRSARQRLDLRLPGDVGFDTQPVRIDGRPVSLEQGAAGEYFVPLTAARADEPFVLEIRYTVRGGGLRIAVPEFPKEPAVQKVYLSVYIPSEWSYLGFVGAWDDEMVWVLKGCTTWPRAAQGADWLMNWVCEGVEGMDRQTAAGFATDGRNLLYATLRPAPSPDGDLRVRVLHAHLIQGLLMSAILVAGLLLLPASGAARAVAAGAAAILLVAMGIFLPSAARAVVNNGTVGAGFAVLVVWALWHLVVVRPRASNR